MAALCRCGVTLSGNVTSSVLSKARREVHFPATRSTLGHKIPIEFEKVLSTAPGLG